MRIATRTSVLFASVAMLALPLSVARAQLTAETIQGRSADAIGGVNLVAGKDQGNSATNALTTVYDNTSAAGLYGVSSTDLASVWGDELFTAGTGLLSTHKFTVFNSGSSAGTLLTAVVNVGFYDAGTSAYLGGYSTNVNFGAGLNVGFFSIVTVSNLDALNIVLNTTDVLVLQTVTSTTGAANRLGIASMGPQVVGASPTSMYINSATIGGGVPGFYTFANGPADPGYYLAVNPPPVGTISKTWGSLKKLYH
jgi:hypothetical protein